MAHDPLPGGSANLVATLWDAIPQDVKGMADLGATAVTLLTLLNTFLPTLILILTALWWVLRIYESETVQRLIRRQPKETRDGE